MADKISTPYEVSVACADSCIALYHAQTIDEACAIALGYFRNSSVCGISFVVSRGEEIIVRFETRYE